MPVFSANPSQGSPDPGLLLESSLNLQAEAGFCLKWVVGTYLIMEGTAATDGSANGGVRYRVVTVPAAAPARAASTAQADQLASDLLMDDRLTEDGAQDSADAVEEEARSEVPEKRVPANEKRAPAKKAPQPAKDEGAEPRIAVKYWASLAALVLLSVAVFGIPYLTAASPASLTARALNAGTSQERVEAAAQLEMLPGPQSIVFLRKLAEESADPKVQVVVMNGLVNRADIQSIPLFVKAMSDADQAVRQVGYLGALRTMGLDKEKFTYRADDPQEKREAALSELRGRFVFGARPSPPPK